VWRDAADAVHRRIMCWDLSPSVFALVMVGIATGIIIVGAVGFVLMIASAHWTLNGFRFQDGSKEAC
jgi:hypothetical protein